MNTKSFTLQDGIVVITNEMGKELYFNDLKDFNRYCPELDLSNKKYISYMPLNNIYFDLTPSENEPDLKPQFDYLINNINDLIKKKQDIFYNLTIDECKTILINHIKILAGNYILNKYPMWKQINITNDNNQELRDQMTKDINSIRDASNKMEDEINALKKLEKVKAYEIEFPEI